MIELGNSPTRPKPGPITAHNTEHATLSGLHMSGLGSFPFARRY